MTGPGYSSPFPTTHDTVGASTLATRLFMPSSPPPPEDGPVDSPDRAKSPLAGRVAAKTDEARVQKYTSPESSRASSPDREAIDKLNARLADYTVDFSAFPSGQFGQDEDPLPELKLPHEDQLSDVGGPEDFTANMERYLMGMDDDDNNEDEDEEDKEIEGDQLVEDKEHHSEIMPQEQEQEKERQQDSNLEQPNGDDEAELGEYSEFGPPVDMSTPSHFLRRTHALAKEITHLENIEEDPDDEPDPVATPSVRRQILTPNKNEEEEEEEEEEETNEDLWNQIEDLKDAVQARDNQLDRSYKRVLEAASAAEQIKHLQAELQRKTSLLDELQGQRSDEALLREQIQLLQKQNEEKESYLRRSSADESIFTTLQKQIGDMQKELQNRSTNPDLDAERLETIADLRHQLTLSQEQLKKRDAALDETLAKLKEITAAKELQLREKNTEIDGLKAQIDDHLLEIEKLETEVDKANREYQILEERIASLETRNRPLEELNSTLEADLTRVQSQVTAQENALKAMAADLPLETGGSTYTEILELIKDLGGPPTTTRTSELPGLPLKEPRDIEMENLRQELAKLQAELKDASSVRKTLEAELNRSQEQAIEGQTLIKSIEGENTTLTKRADELKSNLDTIQHELNQLKEEHAEALETIDRLHEENKTQQPSPPPSPLTPRNPNQKEKLEESHQAQLKSLQTAHATAISTLRSSHADSTRKLRDRLAVAEKRESKLKAELQHIRSSRSEHETQLQTVRAEIKRLESVIAVKDETAAAVDERIARSVEKREKEWERRIDLLLKERERMGRALLWTLGEKEVGDVKENFDEDGRRTKQAYRYRYAQKSGGKKA